MFALIDTTEQRLPRGTGPAQDTPLCLARCQVVQEARRVPGRTEQEDIVRLALLIEQGRR